MVIHGELAGDQEGYRLLDEANVLMRQIEGIFAHLAAQFSDLGHAGNVWLKIDENGRVRRIQDVFNDLAAQFSDLSDAAEICFVLGKDEELHGKDSADLVAGLNDLVDAEVIRFEVDKNGDVQMRLLYQACDILAHLGCEICGCVI